MEAHEERKCEFKIEKLEDRIAPGGMTTCGLGSLIGSLTNPCGLINGLSSTSLSLQASTHGLTVVATSPVANVAAHVGLNIGLGSCGC